jgi:hypothetical protein
MTKPNLMAVQNDLTELALFTPPSSGKGRCAFMGQTGQLKRSFDGDDGFAFVVCRICGDIVA